VATTKPVPFPQVVITGDIQRDGILRQWFEQLRAYITDGVKILPVFAVADLPDATLYGDGATWAAKVAVSDDATYGFCEAFSDGANWIATNDPTHTIA